MKTYSMLAVAAFAMGAAQAGAQDAPDPHGPAHAQDHATDAAGEMDLSEPENPLREFTDAEIESFAAAATEIRELDPDGTLDPAERQQQAGAIVESHGLTPESYNTIGTAAQADPEIAQRIRAAMPAAEPRQG